MPHENQGELERAHLEGFRKACAGFPGGTIIEKEGNPVPDFQVAAEDQVVGIELTRVFHPEGDRDKPLQARETHMFEIAEAAKGKYDNRGNPPVRARIYFNNNAILERERVDPAATQIVRVLEENLPSDQENSHVRPSGWTEPSFPREVDSCSLTRVTVSDGSQFFPSMSGWHPEVPVSQVREAFRRKNEHVGRYMQAEGYERRCTEVWLVIVIDGRFPSTFMDAAGDALEVEYESPFDRAYLFQFAKGHARRLKTADPAT